MQPSLPAEKSDVRADMAACRTLLRSGSRTFYMASFLLPRAVREPASALYGFCRIADDAVDVDGGAFAAIADLRERLDCAYAGRPANSPIDRAFADAIARFEVPRELPEALITGLEWDAEGRRYDDLTDLHGYATRVAGTVGAMMAALMQVRSHDLIARACDLGIAMQLTNIARDVGEDARSGRIYLPLSWMREAGVDVDAWLTNPQFSPQLARVISRLLDTADIFYERSDPAILKLPPSCRPGIRSARVLYAEIGHDLRRHGCNSVDRRSVVPTRRKLELVATALTSLRWSADDVSQGCLEEAQFLVDAIVSQRPGFAAHNPPSWWDLRARFLRVIDIFEQIERRERSANEQRNQRQAIA